jgi:hypothetical protein
MEMTVLLYALGTLHPGERNSAATGLRLDCSQNWFECCKGKVHPETDHKGPEME